MQIEPEPTTQPISDDQELAKVLAGVNQDVSDGLTFEEPEPEPEAEPVAEPVETPFQPVLPEEPESLDDIKRDALYELRPLIELLDIVPEEKFDIYLLLLRSSDDKTLIAPAHNAAKNIKDEARRAQALLDIIKEIDFLTSPTAPAA